jgi:hypothetical protein
MKLLKTEDLAVNKKFTSDEKMFESFFVLTGYAILAFANIASFIKLWEFFAVC